MSEKHNEHSWENIEGKPGIAVLENYSPNTVANNTKIQEAVKNLQAIEEFRPRRSETELATKKVK